MRRTLPILVFALAPLAAQQALEPRFEHSDQCVACHNGLATLSGADVSIGYAWRASVMANSSRDPYWQASVRREIIALPKAQAHIEDECSVCHMPAARYAAHLRGRSGQVFAHLPFNRQTPESAHAEDGVNCSVCHQIGTEKLGERGGFNGRFVAPAPPAPDQRPEFGPFDVAAGRRRIMQSSSGGFVPTQSEHIRRSETCATCHTLYTQAHAPDGKVIGELPEQTPYLEWLHSGYRNEQSCQDCHMPRIAEAAPITSVYGELRQGLRHHDFVGGNFLLPRLLNRSHAELSAAAEPRELTAAAEGAIAFLQSSAAQIRIERLDLAGERLSAVLSIDNLTGHKLPTAYPSRRVWVHFLVRDRNQRAVFESGALRPDGSIAGNDNDADAARFEPHYAEITEPGQVAIYESIMKTPEGRVTTGLLSAVGYLKDNRILPAGFDKQTAPKDVAVMGEAATDDGFAAGAHRLRYSVPVGGAEGPYTIEAELWYQPVGFRWTHNLKAYAWAVEPNRFIGYFSGLGASTATVLARDSASCPRKP